MSDFEQVRAAFDRAASTYRGADPLHREVQQRLFERVQWMRVQPERVLDVGCGPISIEQPLLERFGQASLVSLDVAPKMLQQARLMRAEETMPRFWSRLWRRGWPGQRARSRFVCADMARLPFADDSFDWLYSNLALQWAPDLAATLAQFFRVLKPGGLLLVSSFGPDTLKELRAAWRAVDEAEHVNHFVDLHDLGDALLASGFENPVTDMEMLRLSYAHPRQVLSDLRALGASVVVGRESMPRLGRDSLARLMGAYPRENTPEGKAVFASYEVVYAHAWKPAITSPGHQAVPFVGLKDGLG